MILGRIVEDFKGYLFKGLNYGQLKIMKGLSTVYIYTICSLKGITISKNCSFYGITHFHRAPGSKITIEENCQFRNNIKSNLIGINHKCIISTLLRGSLIVIGENSGFSGTVISASERIEIGKNVLCGANSLLTDFDWHPEKFGGKANSKPIIIKDNVWLGLNTIVLKGVTIGENSRIGANSVVVNDIPANVIAAGNPCRVIRPLDNAN